MDNTLKSELSLKANPDIFQCPNQAQPNSFQHIHNVLSEFYSFFKNHTVFEALPENMKYLILNKDLTISECINAMLNEDAYSSYIYDETQNKILNIVSLKDILILMKFIYDKLPEASAPFTVDHFIKKIFKKDKKKISNFTIGNKFILNNPCNIYTSNKNYNNKDDFNINEDYAKKLFEDLNRNKNKNVKIEYNQLKEAINIIKIIDYLNILKDPRKNANNELISINIDLTLDMAINKLLSNNIQRLLIENPKVDNSYNGFVNYELIFSFLIDNFVIETRNKFKISIKDCEIFYNKNKSNMLKFNKNEKLINIFIKCIEKNNENNTNSIDIILIYNKENDDELFGFIYLKDIIYFLNNDKFDFDTTAENFLNDIYSDIDYTFPLGKERIFIISYNDEDISLIDIFEMINSSPEKKIVIKKENEYLLMNIYNILEEIIKETGGNFM